MAKAIDNAGIVPMLFQRFTDEFGAPSWAKPISNAFDLTNLVQAIQAEAGAKGMAVFISVSLCPLEWFYGPAPDAEPQPTQPTGENEDDHATEHPG